MLLLLLLLLLLRMEVLGLLLLVELLLVLVLLLLRVRQLRGRIAMGCGARERVLELGLVGHLDLHVCRVGREVAWRMLLVVVLLLLLFLLLGVRLLLLGLLLLLMLLLVLLFRLRVLLLGLLLLLLLMLMLLLLIELSGHLSLRRLGVLGRFRGVSVHLGRDLLAVVGSIVGHGSGRLGKHYFGALCSNAPTRGRSGSGRGRMCRYAGVGCTGRVAAKRGCRKAKAARVGVNVANDSHSPSGGQNVQAGKYIIASYGHA